MQTVTSQVPWRSALPGLQVCQSSGHATALQKEILYIAFKMKLITSKEFGFTKDYFLFRQACYLLLKAAVEICSEVTSNSTLFCTPNFMLTWILTQLCNHLDIILWIVTRSSPTLWLLSSMQKLNAQMKKICLNFIFLQNGNFVLKMYKMDVQKYRLKA